MKSSEIINQFEGNHIIRTGEIVTLYHGSKSGISSAIAPISRERCDFVKGFYMGTDRTQPLTLICNYPDARIYTLNVNLPDLKILDDVYDRLQWACEEYSYEIYKIANAKTMSECWLGFHTFDVEMAIDDLKEIYQQKMSSTTY